MSHETRNEMLRLEREVYGYKPQRELRAELCDPAEARALATTAAGLLEANLSLGSETMGEVAELMLGGGA